MKQSIDAIRENADIRKNRLKDLDGKVKCIVAQMQSANAEANVGDES